jgi:hypothetical protein
MGMSVRFKPYVRRSVTAAEWSLDGTEIVIYVTTQCTKIEKILSLIHEASHMKGFIDNDRKNDPKIEEALSSEEEKKIYRKRILDMEVADAVYWEDIYKDTNCKFPIWKLKAQKDFDIWQYQVYYETGRFPKGKEKQAKLKELKKKPRGKV